MTRWFIAPRTIPSTHLDSNRCSISPRVSQDASDFAPSTESMTRAQSRLRIGIAQRRLNAPAPRKTPLLIRALARPFPLAAIASTAVLALVVALVAGALGPFAPASPPTIPPQQTNSTVPGPTTGANPPETTPVDSGSATTPPPNAGTVAAIPNAEGNFVFYLSDAPNDIGDFSSLAITVDSVELKPQGGGPWVTITPEAIVADLVQLQGDVAVELWRGDVPEGEYTTAFIHVSTIQGILASSGEQATVTLPSDKLHVTTDFSVVNGTPTEFVFDITVHATGNAGEAARYLIQPQADESGVGRSIQIAGPGHMGEGVSGQQGNAGDSSQGENPGHHDNSPSPVEPPTPGPGPGPSSQRPRNRTDISST